MFGSLLYTVRSSDYIRPLAAWWRDLVFFWCRLEKGNLIFFSGLGLLIAVAVFAVHISVAGHNRLQAERDLIRAEHTRIQELTCLALNVYHEARGEPIVGQYAVAEVTINRVASRRYPNTICEVVYEKKWDRIRRRYVGAFSWTELGSTPELRIKEWKRAWKVAEDVCDEREGPKLKGALFYHAKYIRPSWASEKQPVARIGMHIFYL
jgi:spore germination cell wall hydrolase CwlJ-like protein